jgi:hypothetical protein
MPGAMLTLMDLARRTPPMAKKLTAKKRTPNFHPGGEKGKLHRELGIPEDEKIPADRLAAAEHSKNPEIRRDAIRAKTMEGWHHGGSKASKRYSHPRSAAARGE